ncbi:hypothetical protein ACEYW6_22495, partial [Nostoc sp. UIC 10607]|uniref:hypothetical protein n=1 Tax=Nostoc sp. UIC 10607 TaxID=3045935 RepID=UPI00399FCAD7
WMHRKMHVQIEMGGARDNTLHRPNQRKLILGFATLYCNSSKSLLGIETSGIRQDIDSTNIAIHQNPY